MVPDSICNYYTILDKDTLKEIGRDSLDQSSDEDNNNNNIKKDTRNQPKSE